MCKIPRRGCHPRQVDETTGPASPSTSAWNTLLLRIAHPSRPQPRDRLAQRIVDWTDVLYYVLSRGIAVAALIQLLLHGPTLLHHL
jgi:hypothetical protein